MKKSAFFLMLFILLPIAAAVTVQSPETIPLLVLGSNNESVSYTLTITNTGPSGDFQLYSLVGILLKPNKIYLESNTPNVFAITASPDKRVLERMRGFVKFEYEIFSSLSRASKHELLMRIIELKDAFYASPTSFQPGDAITSISLQNLENFRFENLTAKFSSDIIHAEKTITLEPYQILNLTLDLDKEALKRLSAGTYPLDIMLSYNGAKDTLRADMKYLEKGGISVSESTQGTLVRTKLTEKSNEGNIPATVTLAARRDILTRLITTYEPSPETIYKKGFFVQYTWQKQLGPSEKLTVTSTTNYTLPVLILLAIIIIVLAVKIMLARKFTLVKHVSFVRTKGGEFALKVTIHAKTRAHVQNISIIDRIPHAMKLYDSYGTKPNAINEGTRTLTWSLPHLNAGEERVFSYIIYSKMRVVGSFELPLAHADFMQNNKRTAVSSNKTSFAAEWGHAGS